MSSLVVDRMTATGPAELQARTRGLLAGVADRRLSDALRRSPLPEGDWYLRRLDVPLALDPARPDPSIEEAWAAAVVDALHAALRTRSADVVRYRHRVDALVDLVASLAGGDVERAWAWHRAGLLPGADPGQVGGDRAAVALTALRAAPETVVAVLVRALSRVGLPRLHRLWGSSGWVTLAELAATAMGARGVDALLQRYADARSGAVPGTTRDDGPSPAPAAAGAWAERASGAVGSSRLAAAFRASTLRPDEPTTAAWAVLVVAEADPAALRRADVAAAVAGVVDAVSERPARGATVVSETRAGPGSGAAEPEELDTEPERWPTVWGGLPFVLATAAEAGVPDRLTEDATLAERPLSWCLHRVATRLVPAADDDPAALVLAGLPVPFEAPSPAPRPPGADEAARLDEVARAWVAATARRLEREDAEDPFEVVRDVALRRGEVAWEPGWVDVHLRLDDVDVDVRRAGLDLDPGWVPWLGTVVRFVHG